MRLLAIAFLFVCVSAPGANRFDYQRCAADLTQASRKVVSGGLDAIEWRGPELSAIHFRPGSAPQHGWTVLEPRNLPSLLAFAGVPMDEATSLVTEVMSFEMGPEERQAVDAQPNQDLRAAAYIASYGVGAFRRLPQRPLPERRFYVTVLPKGKKLKDDRLAAFVYVGENFEAIDFSEFPKHSGVAISSHGPIRELNALVLTYPEFDSSETRVKWIADVVRAFSIYSDFNLIYTWCFSNRLLAQNKRPMDQWFEMHVDITEENFYLFEKAFLTLTLESRANAARAYAMSKLSGLPFNEELRLAMQAALKYAREEATPSAVDSMDLTEDNLFRDFSVMLDPEMKKTIEAARPFRGRSFRN